MKPNILFILDKETGRLVLDCEDCKRIVPKEQRDCKKCIKRPCG